MFADVKDDDDDEFEIVPVKPSQTADDFSDGLCCMSVFSASLITGIIARWTNVNIESTQRLILGFCPAGVTVHADQGKIWHGRVGPLCHVTFGPDH